MSAPTDHLLITLAAVAPGSRVLEIGTGAASHLVRLGFEVWTEDRAGLAEAVGEVDATRTVVDGSPDTLPEAHVDWVALALADGHPEPGLAELRRVLRPGGWFWLAVENADPEDLLVLALGADLALAEKPVHEGDWSRGIFRRVQSGVLL